MKPPTNRFDISSKTILLTGATGYLGKHISHGLLEEGARVVLLGRSTKLDLQTAELKSEFGRDAVTSYCVDFYDRTSLHATLSEIGETHKVDVLINNAYDLSPATGFNTKFGRLENIGYQEWLASFESGIYWAAIASQIFGRFMTYGGKGCIINISSMYGVASPNPALYEGKEFFNPPTYGVAKAGLLALTRYTASFWGKYGVRCNAIAPGPFPANVDDEFRKRLEDRTVLGRVGVPEDLMGAIILLASDSSSFMTGQTLIIDGGWTIT